MDMVRLLQMAKERSASDLHMVSANPPLLRIHGHLEPVTDFPPLTPGDMEQALDQIASAEQKADFDRRLELGE